MLTLEESHKGPSSGLYSTPLFVFTRPVTPTLQVFGRFCVLRELQEVPHFGHQRGPHLTWARKEELLARVCVIHTPTYEVSVQFRLECHRVFREEQRVHVEPERDGRTPQFVHSLNWFQTAGQSDLDGILTECSSIGNHINIARPNIGRPVVILGDGTVSIVPMTALLGIFHLDRWG
jgi:hypothetical protein